MPLYTQLRASHRLIRILLVLLAIIPSIGWAKSYLTMFAIPGDIEPFTDANTYVAAGERLNIGHSLYGPLRPEDRQVLMDPVAYNAPLVSPPTIAAIWRPLAALPLGMSLWLVAVWAALLGAVVWCVYRAGLAGLAVALALEIPIGNQLAIGNVTAFFPALLILLWLRRRSPWSAAIVSLMATIKIFPAAMFGWSRISRRQPWIVWGIGSMALILGATAIVTGLEPFRDYIDVARQTLPSPLSLSGLTGVPWATFAVLIVGTAVATLIRDERWSFWVCVTTLVAGTPAMYYAGLVPLLALLAPIGEANHEGRLWPFPIRAAYRPPHPTKAPLETIPTA